MATQALANVELNAEQQEEAERIYQQIHAAFDAEARCLARLMAAKPTAEIFGQTEFDVRDRLHDLGTRVFEATADARVKKGRLSRC
jgi:hypothetical protein